MREALWGGLSGWEFSWLKWRCKWLHCLAWSHTPSWGSLYPVTGWCKDMRAQLPCPNSGPFWRVIWAPDSPTPHLAVGSGSCDCNTAQILPLPRLEPSPLPCLYWSWELILIKPLHIHLWALASWWTWPMPALSLALPSSLGWDLPHQSGPISYHLKTISLPHRLLSSTAVECWQCPFISHP